MLSDRIIQTLELFDRQDLSLTILELHRFLISAGSASGPTGLDTLVSTCDSLVESQAIQTQNGLFCLPGREALISDRLLGYRFAYPRWKRIQKYSWLLSRAPFISGIAVNGSQALGKAKASSDIDLLVITKPNRIWLARLCLTLLLQLFGIRRHGQVIANRFCLNHYLTENADLKEQNFYTAWEYAKAKPIKGESLQHFFQANLWIKDFFPNAFDYLKFLPKSKIPLYKYFGVGDLLEKWLGSLQQLSIKIQPHIIVKADELSLHLNSKQDKFLADLKAS